jgi:hypothetical protein
MTKRFGFREKSLPTKNELIQSYDERLKQLAGAISQVAQIGARTDQQLQQRLVGLSTLLGDVSTDLRAMQRLLEASGVVASAAHQEMVSKIQIEDFDLAVKMEDESRKLVPATGSTALGSFTVIKMDVFQPDSFVVESVANVIEGQPPVTEKIPNPKAGEKIERFCKLRSRVQIGSGDLHPVIERELIGLKVGDVKEFDFTMPAQIPDKEFAGKSVKFKVEVIDIKQEPPKPQPDTAPTEQPNSQEEVNETEVSQ